ncbi:TetR family transcriptional regulator [Actinacidiphila glaucinigra]|uniref:TetR/AcrR family transcriptional regulator n=1 Tax=Actinacidiphila glaucinigra TaxID=235986 RepID=UPI0033A66877
MGTESSVGATRLWDRTRQAAMTEIYDTALRLFTEQGFEATTIDQIAREVGISRRSFFRYFGTKEDIICGDLDTIGPELAAALDAQPADTPVWQALRDAFAAVVGAQNSPDTLAAHRLVHVTPSLRARRLEKQLRWHEALIPRVSARLNGVGCVASDAAPSTVTDRSASGAPGTTYTPASTPHAPGAMALVGSVIACADAALEAWLARDGEADLVALFDEAIATVRA